MTKPNAILLIDYENLYCGSTNNHQLKLTLNGFNHLISHCQSLFEVDDKKIYIACHYKDYAEIESLIEGSDYSGINAIEKSDNMTDGYLIAYGTMGLMENKGSFDEAVLIGGDKIYTGMVRVAAKMANKVHIFSWEDSLAEVLESAHKKVQVHYLEDVFDIRTQKSTGIQNGHFVSYALTPVEEEVIRFALGGKNPNGHMLSNLASTMTKWSNKDVKAQFGGNYFKIFDYLKSCAEGQGFFDMKRKPGTEGKDEVFWLKLKVDHPKVQQVIAKKEKTRR